MTQDTDNQRVTRFLSQRFNDMGREYQEEQEQAGIGAMSSHGDKDNDNDNDKNTPHTASLLGIPSEIRWHILEYVMKTNAIIRGKTNNSFLSSMQQVSAVPLSSASPASSPAVAAAETAVAETTSKPVSVSVPVPNDQHQITNNSTQKQWKWKTKVKTKPSRFTSPSSAFHMYSQSRHLDTALLYTCRLLRKEALPLWYSHGYYLTLVLEQTLLPKALPLPTLPSTSSLGNSSSSSSISSINRNILPDRSARQQRQPPLRQSLRKSIVDKNKAPPDNRVVKYVESRPEEFWRMIAQNLRFPSLDMARNFDRFHVSLFVEESAFWGLDKWNGVKGGLLWEDIVRVLMTRSSLSSSCSGSFSASSQTLADIPEEISSVESDDKEIQFSGASEKETEKMEDVFADVKFSDHTFLKLARNAVDENVSVNNESDNGQASDGHDSTGVTTAAAAATAADDDHTVKAKETTKASENGEAKISLSIESWRV